MPTSAALAFAGLDRRFWDSLVSRRVRTDLPPAKPGKAGRSFEADDLVALLILKDLLKIGVILHVAGFVADQLRGELRARAAVTKLYLVTLPDPDGTARPAIVAELPKDARLLWTIDVAGLRRAAKAAIG